MIKKTKNRILAVIAALLFALFFLTNIILPEKFVLADDSTASVVIPSQEAQTGGGMTLLPADGVCGPASNESFSSAPIINLCSTGAASQVSGSGPWIWICSGSYGGLDSPICAAKKIEIPAVVCAPYITKYIKFGAVNDPVEVKKLQAFLRDYEGFRNLAQTGIYDKATYNAVRTFQAKYYIDVLVPWGTTFSTGYVYIKTVNKINEIYCKGAPVFQPIQEITKPTPEIISPPAPGEQTPGEQIPGEQVPPEQVPGEQVPPEQEKTPEGVGFQQFSIWIYWLILIIAIIILLIILVKILNSRKKTKK